MEENKSKKTDTSPAINEQEAKKEEVVYESNAQRRLRLLGVENDSKIHDESQEIKTGNFWSNLWYKRKWTIIISAFFIIMAIILAISIIFKERTDLSVGYIGPNRKIAGNIQQTFEPYIKDTDKDGEKELSMSVTEHYTKAQLAGNDSALSEVKNKEARDSFYMDIRNNNFAVVFIDKSLYEDFDEEFFTIDELIELGANIDEKTRSELCKDYESAIIVGYTKLAHDNNITDSSVLMCFPKTKVFKKDASTQIEFLNNILAYQNTEK